MREVGEEGEGKGQEERGGEGDEECVCLRQDFIFSKFRLLDPNLRTS